MSTFLESSPLLHSARPSWEHLRQRMGELRDLDAISGTLEWDQETMMPEGGAEARARHLSLLAERRHERLSSPEVGEWLQDLAREPETLSPLQRSTLRWMGRDHARAVRIPKVLVRALAEARSKGFQEWLTARTPGGPGFSAFAPSLQRLLDLTREQAAAISSESRVYDVLLDEFEPGATVESVRSMFTRLRGQLQPLIDAVGGQPAVPPGKWIGRHFPLSAQKDLQADILKAIGFDLSRGRLDEAAHPFSVGTSPRDVRITTRYLEGDPLNALSSTLHEAGHGMYEQGFGADLWGTFASDAPSFGMHESQSRFWENVIGRSLPFFTFVLPLMRSRFPGLLEDVSATDLYRDANRVTPSLIRVDADEATYNLHIIIRTELEIALFDGDLRVSDLPLAWNERYRKTLGIEPPDEKTGVLQDVHWAHGAFGYFPSYTFGNLYAASFSRRMEEDLPDLWAYVEVGNLAPVLAWLRENIHQHGRLWDSPSLFARVAAGRDPVEDLAEHLWGRHGRLSGLARPVS